MQNPVAFYMDTLEAINDVRLDHQARARDLIRRAEVLQKAARTIENSVADELAGAGGSSRSNRERHVATLSDPLTRSARSWTHALRGMARGLRVGRDEQDAYVPTTPAELARAARTTSSAITLRRQICLAQVKTIEDDAFVHLGKKLDPESRVYLLLQYASRYVGGMDDLRPDPDRVTRLVSAQPGGRKELKRLGRESLVPVICGIWVRDQVLTTMDLAANAELIMDDVDASAEQVTETQRHADVLRQQLEAEEAAGARQDFEDERRNREGVLATAGVVLIAPGLVASVYGADVLKDDGSDLGMVLLMALAVVVGFLAVRLISHGNRRASPNEAAFFELLVFAVAVLVLLVARSRAYFPELHDWERASVGVLGTAAGVTVFARLAQRDRPVDREGT